jgi:hypothetical protein
MAATNIRPRRTGAHCHLEGLRRWHPGYGPRFMDDSAGDDGDVVSVERTIPAPPKAIFDLLADRP